VLLLERLEAKARARDPRVVQVMASLAGEHETVLIARSDGLLVADVRPLSRVSITVIVEENGRREQGYAGGGGRFDYGTSTTRCSRLRAPRGRPGAREPRRARRAGGHDDGRARQRLAGHPAARGDRPRAGRRLQPQGDERVRGRVGERVAAKGITVVDDGTLDDRRGSLNLDDEGNPRSAPC
jgi:TldD protein